MRGLGSENVDFRLRQSDFSIDGKRAGAPWLGMKIAELGGLDRVLVVGSFLRKDHPLIANRLRQAAKRGQQVNLIHVADDDPLIALANKVVCAPKALPEVLAQVLRCAPKPRASRCRRWRQARTPAPRRRRSPRVWRRARRRDYSSAMPPSSIRRRRSCMRSCRRWPSVLGARFGYLGEAANSVGGYLAGCTPAAGGLNAQAMLGVDAAEAGRARPMCCSAWSRNSIAAIPAPP